MSASPSDRSAGGEGRTNVCDRVPDPVRLLDQYRREIQFESEIMSGRVSAYLNAQSFLVIAYASSLGAGWAKTGILILAVPVPLAILGLVLSFDAWISLRASISEIDAWHSRQQELFIDYPELRSYWPMQWQDSTPDPSLHVRFRRGSRFAIHTPWIFGLTWIYLAATAVALYWGA